LIGDVDAVTDDDEAEDEFPSSLSIFVVIDDIVVIIISLKTYVIPWNELPTNIKHAPINIRVPTEKESRAVIDNPITTRSMPIH